MAGGTLAAALAIFAAASVERVGVNHWLLIGLFAAAIFCALIRLARRTSLSVLAGSPVAALWLATRFVVTPALFLTALAWAVAWAFGLAFAATLAKALLLLAVYGGSAILVTSILADLTAAIRGPATAR